MQDARTRYPPFEGWAKTLPARTAALAATPEHGAPQVAEPVAEEAQRHRVTGNSMIAVVALDNTFQPLSTTLTRSCIRSRSTALIFCSVARIRLGWVLRPTTK
jgi:hypothetical protein